MMRRSKAKERFATLLYSIICFILHSNTGYAQNISDTHQIKPISIVTRSNQTIYNDGRTTAIDSLSMIKSLTSSLSELVTQNTSIYIKEYGRGAMTTASFRGTAPSHTSVLWNGIPLNSPMLGMVDFSTIPVYFTDQITVEHGSASLVDQSGALGGLVKIENKGDWQNKFSGRILTGIGSYGTKDEFIKLSLGNTKVQSQTRAFYSFSDNDYTFKNKLIANIDPLTGNYIYPSQKNLNAQYGSKGVLQEFYLHPSQQSFLTFRYWYQFNNRSLPRLQTNETDINYNLNRQQENANRFMGEYKHYGSKGTLTLESGANLQHSTFQLKNKISGTLDQLITDATANVESYLFKATYDYKIKENLNITTTANGVFSSVNSINSPQNSQTEGYNAKRQDHSVTVQLVNIFNKNLTGKLISRTELVGKSFLPIIPSAGLIYHPLANKSFFLNGNLARNYHLPSLNDLYFVPGGNPLLKAEEGTMIDLGSGFSGNLNQTQFKANITAYASGINNWIIWLPTPKGYWEPSNIKRVNTSGIEFNSSVSGKLNSLKYRINGNYAYTRSINRDNPKTWADESIGKQLPYIPRNSANILVDLSREKYHFTWVWNYYSSRFTSTSNTKTSPFDILHPYLMNNIYFGRGINLKHSSLDIELKILNLFNESYRTVLQNPMPGINYSFLIRYDF